MTELKYCRRCKRMFPYVMGPVLCEQCKTKEEEDYVKVRDYLRQFPGESLHQVAKATEVSAGKIQQYLKEGRLELSPDSPITIRCEHCNEPIRTGRFCKDCTKKISAEMQKAGRDLLNNGPNAENKNKDNSLGTGFRYLQKDKDERHKEH